MFFKKIDERECKSKILYLIKKTFACAKKAFVHKDTVKTPSQLRGISQSEASLVWASSWDDGCGCP
jgi:hypothetical protein